MSDRPIIGITTSNCQAHPDRYESASAYACAVIDAGGLPVLLPHEPHLADQYVHFCDGLILTGGDDPATEAFGKPTHPRARPIDPRRQAFELALLDAATLHPHLPVLGICLGVQLMALHAGGRLNQYLPDTLPTAQDHQDNRRHGIQIVAEGSILRASADIAPTVVSSHRQAVDDPGRLRVIATAPDGVIEGIDDPRRAFYLGVQWHPERGGDEPFSGQLFHQFVAACRRAR